MSDCIFGIKCNGVSIAVSQITINDDQTRFDYICNVSLMSSNNGNGTYDISIVNKDNIQGMPVGKWRIKKAWINYNWGDSSSLLIMEDEDGNETTEIVADKQKGSMSGFSTLSLTRSIFTRAQVFVRDYPNALIYNAIVELNESKRYFNLLYLNRYRDNVLNKSDETYIEYFGSALIELSKHLVVFNKVKEQLEELDDQRSKILLKDITTDCRKLLEGFIECNS